MINWKLIPRFRSWLWHHRLPNVTTTEAAPRLWWHLGVCGVTAITENEVSIPSVNAEDAQMCCAVHTGPQRWRKHIMMTSSNGTIFRVTGPLCGEFTGPCEFPAQRPVTQSFDVFFDLRLNIRLSKHTWGWWFETPPWSLWRQCHDMFIYLIFYTTHWSLHTYSICCTIYLQIQSIMTMLWINSTEMRYNTFWPRDYRLCPPST